MSSPARNHKRSSLHSARQLASRAARGTRSAGVRWPWTGREAVLGGVAETDHHLAAIPHPSPTHRSFLTQATVLDLRVTLSKYALLDAPPLHIEAMVARLHELRRAGVDTTPEFALVRFTALPDLWERPGWPAPKCCNCWLAACLSRGSHRLTGDQCASCRPLEGPSGSHSDACLP